jgi:hypothetical protein
MGINSSFAYHFVDPDIQYKNPTGVFKLSFGRKYFIFKGLRIATTVENLSKQLHREISKPKDDSVLFKVVAYLRKQRTKVMDVDVLFESDAIIDVLMAEYEALKAAKEDPDCLNTKFINNEYFPNWIPQHVINDFLKRLQGVGPTNNEKNLKRFLSNHIENEELVERVVKYVTTHFRGAAPRKKRNESNKDISKKRTD